MDWAADELLKVMSMNLDYFEKTTPVIKTMLTIIIAIGWALLLGNLIYQAIRTMLHGAGFESEDPKILGFRTAVFAFLLIVSREICNIGLSISGQIIEWLQIPEELELVIPAESAYDVGSSAQWLIAIIVGFILIFQIVKLLFEIGERYVVFSVLTYFAPLAFGLGGSKNTQDIFKSWCRMYCSMLVMMIMSTAFLKLIISAMEHAGDGNILIWVVFVVALTRVARKIDSHIARIGLNPAITGDGLGSRIPGVLTAVAVRTMASTVRHNGRMGSVPIAPSASVHSANAGGGARPASAGPPISKFNSSTANSNTSTQSVEKPANIQNTFGNATENQFSSNNSETSRNHQQGGAVRPGTAQGKITPDLAGNKPSQQAATVKSSSIKPEPITRTDTSSSRKTAPPSKVNQEQLRTPIPRINTVGQNIRDGSPAATRIGHPPSSAAQQIPIKSNVSPVPSTNLSAPDKSLHDTKAAIRPSSASEVVRPGTSVSPAGSASSATHISKSTASTGASPAAPKGKVNTPGINVPASTHSSVTEQKITTNMQHTSQVQRSHTGAQPIHNSDTQIVSPKAYQSPERERPGKQRIDPAAINKSGATYQNGKRNPGTKRGDKK